MTSRAAPVLVYGRVGTVSSILLPKLSEDCDAVPCLECGKYQQHMIVALKRDFQFGGRHTAAILFVLAGIAAAGWGLLVNGPPDFSALAWVPAACAILLVICGIFLLSWRRYQLSHFDPNSDDIADRMKISAQYARSIDEFRTYLREFGVEWSLPENPQFQ